MPRALRSVEGQTLNDYELLIVDDGSVDGLEELIIPEILNRPNWRYLKHTHRGLAWTRNIGIHAALGEYITFLDSDDEYRPEHLRLRLRYLREHSEIDVIHGGVEIEGPEETHWVVDVRDPSRRIHIQDCCVGATLFAKKTVFLSVGGFPIVSYSPEFHLLQKLQARYCVKKVDFPTYVYHTSGTDRICSNQKTLQHE